MDTTTKRIAYLQEGIMEPMIVMTFGAIVVQIFQTTTHGIAASYSVVCKAGTDKPVTYDGFNNPIAATLFAADRLINWENWI